MKAINLKRVHVWKSREQIMIPGTVNLTVLSARVGAQDVNLKGKGWEVEGWAYYIVHISFTSY